jgi:hypothetical protein
VHFHDADDVLAPEFVERAKARIASDAFDVLLFNYEQVDDQTGLTMSRSHFEATDVIAAPLRYMLLNTVNNGGVYAVDALRQAGGFDEDPAVRHNDDRAFHLRLAERGMRFDVDPYVGSRFHFSAGSMSAANKVRCLRAHSTITRRFAVRRPQEYRPEIAALAWHDAAGLASCLDWSAADECVRLAISHGARVPCDASALFRSLCRVNPHWALRVREKLIRFLKPGLRVGYPSGARQG